jgi:hypothetical protein
MRSTLTVSVRGGPCHASANNFLGMSACVLCVSRSCASSVIVSGGSTVRRVKWRRSAWPKRCPAGQLFRRVPTDLGYRDVGITSQVLDGASTLARELIPLISRPRGWFPAGLMEGVAVETWLPLVAELGGPFVKSIRTVGGGSKNAAWRTIRARRLGTPFLDPVMRRRSARRSLLARKSIFAIGSGLAAECRSATSRDTS